MSAQKTQKDKSKVHKLSLKGEWPVQTRVYFIFFSSATLTAIRIGKARGRICEYLGTIL